MSKVVKTFEQILECNNVSLNYIKEVESNGRETKFTYALKKAGKKYASIIEQYFSLIEDIEVKYAVVEESEKGVKYLLKKEVNGIMMLQYSSESDIKCRAEKMKLWNEWKEKEFEIDNYIVDKEMIPEDLTYTQLDVFKDFVI